jgi:type I restriction enzyme S subunit
MGNIVNGGLVCEDLKYLPATHGEFPDLLLDKGDVLFNRTNSAELVGKTAVYKGIPNPSSFASYLIRVRLVDEYFPDLLAYYINSVFGRKWISTVVSQQVGQANVNGTKLQALSIPVPPLAEQRRIVAKIEELFTKLNAGVESLKAAKAQIKRYRQSVLKAAVEGELTREWRERHKDELEPASVLLDRILRERRAKWEANQLSKMQAQGKTPKDDKWKAKYQEPAAPDVTGLPTLPNGWIWTTLPQLGELNRGKSKHRPRNDPKLYGGKYPFVQTGDIRHANGILRTYNQTYSEDGLKQSRLWKAGTLCITIAANIAETAILGFDACFPDSVVGFVAEFEHCNVRFVEAFFRTAKEDIERYAPATAQKNINLEILSDLAIPLPPLAEQDQIVAEVDRRLSVSDEIEATLDADLKRAERLRQSILKRAFEGKLVLQDPNDEPASVLLERIKAERTQQTSSG